MARPFSTVYGVDFSGARLAGKTLWVAKARVGRRLRLAELFSLSDWACRTTPPSSRAARP